MKACPATITLALRSRFSPRIGRSRALRRPWSVSSGLLAWDLGVVEGRREQLIQEAGIEAVPVGGDLGGRNPSAADGLGEEPPCGLSVPPSREEDVDDLAELVDGPEQVAPGPPDL